jgi:hypothetical protein
VHIRKKKNVNFVCRPKDIFQQNMFSMYTSKTMHDLFFFISVVMKKITPFFFLFSSDYYELFVTILEFLT